MSITNNNGINLPLAVWLVQDNYDYVRGVENYISATGLMKPLRQMVLPARIPPELQTEDVVDFIARSLGNSIHDAIEKAWSGGRHVLALQKLGYPDAIIERIRVNPTDEELRASNEIIPVYLEQRALRELIVDGKTYTIGGKFDLVAEGIVQDYKSTSVWGWIKGTKDDDHQLQGSIYRWLNPGKITEDYIRINYIFTDWSKAMMNTVANYPAHRVEYKDVPLLTVAETEAWITAKIRLYERNKTKPEAELPECTDEELWRSEPQFKYYTDPAKTTKSTKNFKTLVEANAYMAEKGGKGIVITKPGEVKACGYCRAFAGCTQKDRYFSAP